MTRTHPHQAIPGVVTATMLTTAPGQAAPLSDPDRKDSRSGTSGPDPERDLDTEVAS